MSVTRFPFISSFAGTFGLALVAVAGMARAAPIADLAASAPVSPLLAIDQNRTTVIDRIVRDWGEALARSNAGIDAAQLRELLAAMRADQLLAASLAGSLEGLRNVVASALVTQTPVQASLLQAKALGDGHQDVVYVPVTPCRLVETRGTFAAVYQGGGPFTPNQVRTYTLQAGNGVCLTQLPAILTPSAIQLQVFGIPTTTGSGDIEILPQGGTFGSTATMVYLGNNLFTTAAATSLVNLANKQISVQVRGGGAHVAMDVVGYFRAPLGGFVTGVTAGTGLTGGTIISTGTIAADTTYLQRRVSSSCTAGSSIRAIAADGTVTCETDDVGTGTVTSVGSGTGLTGGPITTSGTLSVNTAVIQSRVTGTCTAGSSIRTINADGTVTCETDDGGAANAFVQNGNAFSAQAVLGTTDNFALDVRVNSSRVMRYEPNAISPNVIGGSPANNVTAGVRGATIGGGGVPAGDTDPNFANEAPNRVTDTYGTVAGGYGNVAGDDAGAANDKGFATVGGGFRNTASGFTSTVGGGVLNIASGLQSSTVGGGGGNAASGHISTIGGGGSNMAIGSYSTVGGGLINTASGDSSTVGGGNGNTASGDSSFAVGRDNLAQGDYSVALGRRAKNLGDGSFQFADSSPFDYSTSGTNNFRARATGGVRFTTAIDGNGDGTWSCVTTDGNGWTCTSDRNQKQNLVELEGQAVLARLVAMPIYQWQPKGKNAHVKHFGPMAQDFMAAFGLGDDDKMIGFQDADGVALAAIKGLYQRLQARESDVASLTAAVRRLEALLETR